MHCAKGNSTARGPGAKALGNGNKENCVKRKRSCKAPAVLPDEFDEVVKLW